MTWMIPRGLTRRDVYLKLFAAAAEGKLVGGGGGKEGGKQQQQQQQQQQHQREIYMLAPTLVASAR